MKQVIIVRKDLKLPAGKLAAQVGHASVEAVLRSNKDAVSKWRNAGAAKIVLKVDNKERLYEQVQNAKEQNLVTAVITDAGKTVIAPGTVTCAAIGPAKDEEIDFITSELKLL